MKLRIDDSIKLFNHRKVEANIKAGRESHKGKLNGALIGRMLYPGQKENTVYQSMNNLRNGKSKSVKLEQVHKICEACGVDPNFLFGFPSKHDKDFSQINK